MSNTSDFVIVNIIESISIKKGYVNIKITETMADALMGIASQMMYPTCLLLLTNDNAYAIGYKMASYYSYDQNMKMNRNNRLKVETLLRASNIPLIEDLKDNARHWRERIKEPLEEALDALYQIGYLKNWSYCKPKGIALTDEEALKIEEADYQTFINLLVDFEPCDFPDQSERLQRKEERTKSQIEKAKKKDTKSSKKT